MSLIEPASLCTPCVMKDHIVQKMGLLDQKIEEVKTSGIQSVEKSRYNALADFSADILIADNGNINRHLFNPLIEAIFQKHYPANSYQEHLIVALKNLKNKKAALEKIEAIPLNVLIKDTNILKENESVKNAVLSALLSYLRQGVEGSCFIFPLALQLLHEFPEKCVDDFLELLTSGKLQRTIDGIEKDISYLLRISDVDLSNCFTLDEDFKVVKENITYGYLFQSPGIVQALATMGIVECEQMIQEHCKPLEETTPYELFKTIIEKIQIPQPQHALFKACFAFSLVTHNPLLAIWRNTLTSIAEQSQKGSIHRHLIKTLRSVVSKDCSEDTVDIFIEKVKKKIHHHYDPMVKGTIASYGKISCTEGAFILFYRGGNKILIPLSNEAQFTQFLKKISTNIPNFPVINEIFIKKIIRNYEKNFAVSSCFKITPWCTYSGSSLEKILSCYFPDQILEAAYTLRPLSAEDLLYRLIAFAQNLPQDTKQKFLDDPCKTLAIRVIGLHTFSFHLGYKEFAYLWNCPSSPRELLNQLPKIEPLKLDKQQAIHTMHALLPAHIQEAFTEKMSSLRGNLPVNALRNEMVRVIFNLLNITKIDKQEWILKVDSAFINSLSKEEMIKLNSFAIPFADSNWAHYDQNRLFCFLMHPFSAKLGLFIMSANKEHLSLVDQQEWIVTKQWQIFSVFNVKK
jgi:hypothetical protein